MKSELSLDEGLVNLTNRCDQGCVTELRDVLAGGAARQGSVVVGATRIRGQLGCKRAEVLAGGETVHGRLGLGFCLHQDVRHANLSQRDDGCLHLGIDRFLGRGGEFPAQRLPDSHIEQTLTGKVEEKLLGDTLTCDKLFAGHVDIGGVIDAIGLGFHLFFAELDVELLAGRSVDDLPLNLEAEELGEVLFGDDGSLGLDQAFDIVNGDVGSVDCCYHGRRATATSGDPERDQKENRDEFFQERSFAG